MVELILYISSASPASVRAVSNLNRILRRYQKRQVSLTIRDLTLEPALGDEDQIAFTPTLCKRAPEPPMRIIGDLSHPQALLDLLEYHGVKHIHGHR